MNLAIFSASGTCRSTWMWLDIATAPWNLTSSARFRARARTPAAIWLNSKEGFRRNLPCRVRVVTSTRAPPAGMCLRCLIISLLMTGKEGWFVQVEIIWLGNGPSGRVGIESRVGSHLERPGVPATLRGRRPLAVTKRTGMGKCFVFNGLRHIPPFLSWSHLEGQKSRKPFYINDLREKIPLSPLSHRRHGQKRKPFDCSI